MRYYELQENLNDKIWYHGSINNFDIKHCKPFTHFGTEKAAMERAHSIRVQNWKETDNDFFIYGVKLNLGKSLRVRDGKNMQHTELTITDMLFYTMKFISKEEREEILSASDKYAEIAKIVKSKGYDSMNYKNKYEDTDSTSVIIFDKEQVTDVVSIKKYTHVGGRWDTKNLI